MRRLPDRIKQLEERLLPVNPRHRLSPEELDRKVEAMRNEGRRIIVCKNPLPGSPQYIEIIAGPRQPGALHLERSYGSTGTQETT